MAADSEAGNRSEGPTKGKAVVVVVVVVVVVRQHTAEEARLGRLVDWCRAGCWIGKTAGSTDVLMALLLVLGPEKGQ